jgi:hypothetical protein
MLPFWVSIGLLSLAQGVLVALPRAPAPVRLARLRGRRWALIPPLSVVGFVLVAGAAEHVSAQGLTYLALCAVPLLAALALGWLTPGARPVRALLVPALFVLAWVDRGGLAGEGAALALSGLSCVALGALLASVTPPRWLAAGIVAMALADSALVVSEQLQRPNSALNAAHPAAGLPRLQTAVFGSAVMGYGDLFIAGALGALLAVALGRSWQLRAGALCALLALAFDLLFLLVDELPATVPVAVTLIVVMLAPQPRSTRRRRAPAPSTSLGPRQPRGHRAPVPEARPPGERSSPPARRTPAAP